jgi:hypothetical protein
VARLESYETKLLSGETVTLKVGYVPYMESKGDTRQETTGKQRTVHRVLVPQPIGVQETDQWTPTRAQNCKGERIQVTAHANEHGEIVERWQFSDTDVKWYRIEIADPSRKVLKLVRKDAAA